MRGLRIVLAAGASRRMGQPKALLDLGGLSALARILALSLPDDSSSIVVTGGDAGVVETEARRCGAPFVRAHRWRRGQTASLKAGLAAADEETDLFVVHPVDLPLVTAGDYAACFEAWAKAASPTSIVVASHAMRRGHPLLFGRAVRDEFLALGDDDPARTVVRREPERIIHVDVPNPWVVRDLDTPEDYEAALRAIA